MYSDFQIVVIIISIPQYIIFQLLCVLSIYSLKIYKESLFSYSVVILIPQLSKQSLKDNGMKIQTFYFTFSRISHCCILNFDSPKFDKSQILQTIFTIPYNRNIHQEFNLYFIDESMGNNH